GFLNTGGRYDLSLNDWTPTSLISVPSARALHIAVWTGSRMVIWGGLPSTNTGGQYDPIADSWSPTSLTGAPAARDHHTAVWTGSRMIIWGGDFNGGSGGLNTGGRYDPDADSWLPTSTLNAPIARRGHTAIWTGSRMIVWGGMDQGSYFNSGALYD